MGIPQGESREVPLSGRGLGMCPRKLTWRVGGNDKKYLESSLLDDVLGLEGRHLLG